MKKGFDANVNLTRFAASLKSNGYDFVCRYYNINNLSKNLTIAEAHALSQHGIAIVAVWENGFPTTAGYFSYDKGLQDGKAAYNFAKLQITQPAGTPIYFAVDFDATGTEVDNVIKPYFKGVIDAFNAASQNNPDYLIGVYGSGLTCSSVLSAGLASFTWLACSSGWQGFHMFNAYNIKQSLPIVECADLGGVDGDPDTSPADNEGSFLLPIPAVINASSGS